MVRHSRDSVAYTVVAQRYETFSVLERICVLFFVLDSYRSISCALCKLQFILQELWGSFSGGMFASDGPGRWLLVSVELLVCVSLFVFPPTSPQ